MHEQQRQNREGDRGNQAQANAVGRDPGAFLPLLRGEQLRQKGAAAGSEHGPDGEADVEQRENQGDPRHHIGVVGPADKEGIGQVVDQDDDLTHDGGNRHGAHRPGDRHGPEDLFTGKLLFGHSDRTEPFSE